MEKLSFDIAKFLIRTLEACQSSANSSMGARKYRGTFFGRSGDKVGPSSRPIYNQTAVLVKNKTGLRSWVADIKLTSIQ